MPDLIHHIHAAPVGIVLAVTGGGSSAIGRLLEVPGGSRTVLEGVVPYSARSLDEFLRTKPEQYCSERTARAMAMAAYQRARRLIDDETRSPIGLGCTASLASDRPKRGSHRIHVALQSSDQTIAASLELNKNQRSRAEEESLSAQLILNVLAEGLGLSERLELQLTGPEAIDLHQIAAPSAWRDLMLSNSRAEPPSAGAEPPQLVFPGAFNPLHQGHRRMAEIATAKFGAPVHFEISIENVDKLPLDYLEMQRRAEQFADGNLPLWFTRAPTFEEKSAIFPGAVFLVGVDTLARIGQPCYYHNDPAAAEAAIQQIADRGCRFLVYGRLHQGKFQSLAELPIAPSLQSLCEEVPAEEFRDDVSSTQLRATTFDPL